VSMPGTQHASNRTPRSKATRSDEGLATEADRAPADRECETQAPTRVLAYLTPEEAELLDEVWLELRRQPSRPSKSDILRAALTLAAADRAGLATALATQPVGTRSRQRAKARVIGDAAP
jgi:hypothetical protein